MGEVIDLMQSPVVINKVIDGLIDRIEAGNMLASVYQKAGNEFDLVFDGATAIDYITEDAKKAAEQLADIFNGGGTLKEAIVDYCIAVGAYDTEQAV